MGSESHRKASQTGPTRAQGPKHVTKIQREMHAQMVKLVAEDIDAAEIYSPPKVTQRAKQWGLTPGWSLDLTTKDKDGKAWDFSMKEMRARAINKIKRDRPLLIIGSPMCTDWSSMMNLNWGKMGAEEKERRLKAARRHLRFCVKSCNNGEKIMINDVSRAYFCAPARRQVFVELCEEDTVAGEDMVGELNYSMCGTRDAAQHWGEACASTMLNIGFNQREASPCTLSHANRGLRCYIHGDDFVTVGADKELKWMKQELEKAYEIKTQVLGPNKEDMQQVRVLNRILTCGPHGTSYEADPRHAEIVAKKLGLSGAKGVVTLGTKEEGTTKDNK